jgi:hypothetical protein
MGQSHSVENEIKVKLIEKEIKQIEAAKEIKQIDKEIKQIEADKEIKLKQIEAEKDVKLKQADLLEYQNSFLYSDYLRSKGLNTPVDQYVFYFSSVGLVWALIKSSVSGYRSYLDMKEFATSTDATVKSKILKLHPSLKDVTLPERPWNFGVQSFKGVFWSTSRIPRFLAFYVVVEALMNTTFIAFRKN